MLAAAMITQLNAAEVARDAALGVPRSPHWHAVRDEFIAAHPCCACCGGTEGIEAHHQFPYHLFPQWELDRTKLLALCTRGPAGMNCHFLVGHGGRNWRDYNPAVIRDALRMLTMIECRIRGDERSV